MIQRFREQAERAERLAKSVNDQQTCDALLNYARECREKTTHVTLPSLSRATSRSASAFEDNANEISVPPNQPGTAALCGNYRTDAALEAITMWRQGRIRLRQTAPCSTNKAAGRNMIDRRLRWGGSGRRAIARHLEAIVLL